MHLTPDDDPDADAEGEDDDEMQVDSTSPATPAGPAAPGSAHPSLAAAFAPGPHRPPPVHTSDRGDTSPPTPSSAAPRSESRRKNETQRRAALEGDRLLSAVEPSRVYCSLCQKWVQLRQDSTYCAYPWVQHRAKCVVRNQRRLDKQFGAGAPPASASHGWASQGEDDELASGTSRRGSVSTSPTTPLLPTRRRSSRPDLATPHGRAAFVSFAVDHLFATTYEQGRDQLALPALVAYLNAATPPHVTRPFTDREVADALAQSAPPARAEEEGTHERDAEGEDEDDAEGEAEDAPEDAREPKTEERPAYMPIEEKRPFIPAPAIATLAAPPTPVYEEAPVGA
jgi:hypothetical protein